MSTAIDRRGFIKGAGAATAAIAAFGLAGCASTSNAAANTASSDTGSWDKEYDVIVCGAGIAGLTAALTIATEGDGMTCLLVEKDMMPNGNSPFCGGSTLYTTDADTLAKHFEVLMGNSTPKDVTRAFVDGIAENLDWIKSLGANEADMIITAPGTSTGWEFPEVDGTEALGTFLFSGEAGGASHVHTFLMDAMKERADVIDYQTSMALESLVQDGDTKEVLGVVAGGKRYKANKGVVVCTGGFESNPEMLYDYTGVKAFPHAGKANTGDGLRACLAAGADLWHMNRGTQFWMECRNLENTKFAYTLQNTYTKPFGITVGVNGQRFYMDYDGIVTANGEPGPDLRVNTGCRHGYFQFGGQWMHLPFPDKAWFVFDTPALEAGAAFPDDSSVDIVADGWALKADTLEELAKLIDVPAEELVATADEWNASCAAGKDAAFHRAADTLQPVAEGPFYAMLCAPTFTSTYGGPRRSAKAEVLDPFGNPIPRLYAAGEFGSVWGDLYQGAGMLADCEAFGRIAARSNIAG